MLSSRYIEEDRCVCDRLPKVLYCKNCGGFVFGRVAIYCPRHANVPSDGYANCPYCNGPTEYLLCFRSEVQKYQIFKEEHIKKRGSANTHDWI